MQTSQKQKIILGGGIAGLIQAYFNPEAIIITDQIGGQFSSKFQLGPKYLHVDDNSIRFFEELGVNPSVKKIKIGFHYDGKLNSDNTEENRKRYFEKTRGGSDEPYKSVMSANKTEFNSFDVGVEEIINILKKKVNNKVIMERVTGIDIRKKKVLTASGEIEYEELITTIPRNIFLFLCGKPELAKQFVSYPTTFVLCSPDFYEFDDFDYIYVSESQYTYHRITKTDKGPVFEYKGVDIPRLLNEIDRVEMKVGQLVHNDIKIDFKYVEFFGRYSCWDHSLLTNSLIKQMYEKR